MTTRDAGDGSFSAFFDGGGAGASVSASPSAFLFVEDRVVLTIVNCCSGTRCSGTIQDRVKGSRRGKNSR